MDLSGKPVYILLEFTRGRNPKAVNDGYIVRRRRNQIVLDKNSKATQMIFDLFRFIFINVLCHKRAYFKNI